MLANVGAGGGAMAHIASGDGWQTTFTLVNTGASAAMATLNFYGDNGSAVSLPLSFPQGAAPTSATEREPEHCGGRFADRGGAGLRRRDGRPPARRC